MTIEGMVVMMRMYLSGTLFLLGLVAGVVVPRWVGAFPLETDAPREVPVFRRVLPLGADEPIVLSTNYGNVEVIRTDRDDLELVVRRRRHDDLYLEIEKHGGALHIRSVFGVEPPPGPASLWTFGYELHLPRGTRYEITTGEGRVVGG